MQNYEHTGKQRLQTSVDSTDKQVAQAAVMMMMM